MHIPLFSLFGAFATFLFITTAASVIHAEPIKEPVLALDPEADLSNQDASGTSADESIGYELRTNSKDESKEIWLWAKGGKEHAVRLCETPGWGNMHLEFSPDNYWIMVQDGGASLGISLRLFRREKGVVFKEIQDANINDQAEELALKQAGLQKKPDFLDHRYVNLVRWSPDSRTILVELRGKGVDDKHVVQISEWLGLYDLGKRKFIFDLNQMNRGTVQIDKK